MVPLSSGIGLSPLARGTLCCGYSLVVLFRFIPARAGNTLRKQVHDLLNGGLSPLARGTQLGWRSERAEHRFIPARAGNTNITVLTTSSSSVYPRSRGEHKFDERLQAAKTGLSPLARGTRRPDPGKRRQRRFIPARAGNTCAGLGLPRKTPVYPRSRGEHGGTNAYTYGIDGLSPLARGTRGNNTLKSLIARFIPARAGNTPGGRYAVGNQSVYPRSRGEHPVLLKQNRSSRGLSPLARGTHLRRPCCVHSRTVYPRSRGEHIPDCRRLFCCRGLSPLARGTPMKPDSEFIKHRFIPARAGNTEGCLLFSPSIPVYPRSRGEHPIIITRALLPDGLSPLARGTQPGRDWAGAALRFIPARAGNTRVYSLHISITPVYPRSRGEHSKAIELFYKEIFHIQQSTNLFITSPHF